MPEFTGPRAEGENLGIAYIDAALRRSQCADVILVNRTGDKTNEEILSHVAEFQPHMVGIGLTSHRLVPSLLQLSNQIKHIHHCSVIAGGHYLMFRGEFLMQQELALDAVVLGEGEETIVDIAEAAQRNLSWAHIPGLLVREGDRIVRTAIRTKPLDLDSLAFPTREPGLRVYNVSASRGCYTTCSFCSVPQFTRASPGKPFRLRTPASVRGELSHLHSIGATAISFVDDVFLLPGDKGLNRAMSIADIMHDLRLKWAFSCRTPELTEAIVAYCKPRGLCNIGLGLESGSGDVLIRFSKRASLEHSRRAIALCREYNISIQPYFIMFEPDMSLGDISANISFLDEFGLLWPSYAGNSLDPHPGTPAFEYLHKQSRLIDRGHAFAPIYLDEAVKALRKLIRPALQQARVVELSLRRQQFEAEIAIDDESTRLNLKRAIDTRLAQVSHYTAEFLRDAINGEYGATKFLDNVAAVGREYPSQSI